MGILRSHLWPGESKGRGKVSQTLRVSGPLAPIATEVTNERRPILNSQFHSILRHVKAVLFDQAPRAGAGKQGGIRVVEVREVDLASHTLQSLHGLDDAGMRKARHVHARDLIVGKESRIDHCRV